jgi:CubicO group peptidase (beta-lactamase class C family)
MRLTHLLVCAFLVIAPVSVDGPETPSVANDPRVTSALELARTWLEAQRAYDQIPGVSAAIVVDQQELWSGGFGQADLASGRAASADTIYSICSISKLFTSVAVMRQRDAGKLRLDDPVSVHLPWFALKRTEGEGAVTIEGLLTHASGLPRESDYPYWSRPTSRSRRTIRSSRASASRTPSTRRRRTSSTPTSGSRWPAKSSRRRRACRTPTTCARTSGARSG